MVDCERLRYRNGCVFPFLLRQGLPSAFIISLPKSFTVYQNWSKLSLVKYPDRRLNGVQGEAVSRYARRELELRRKHAGDKTLAGHTR